jgi:ribokinase
VALIVVGPDGQNIIAVAPGANNRLTSDDIASAKDAFSNAQAVVLQLETPVETIFAAAKLGREKGATVILNPAPAPSNPLPESLYPFVDILTPNETEAQILTGEKTPESAAKKLLEWGLKMVIITLGKDGALLATKTEPMRRIMGFRVQAVDCVAAGDAFNGALAVALGTEKPLDDAIRYAHAAAAVSVTRHGAQPSLPTAQEVEKFLKSSV